VQEAVKIINEHRRDHGSGGSCGDSVANMLDWLEWMGVGQATLRYNSSNETKRVAAWLHRGKILLKNLHGWPYGFESFREEVMRWAAVYVKLERPPPVGAIDNKNNRIQETVCRRSRATPMR
jgi:hypothetical protein